MKRIKKTIADVIGACDQPVCVRADDTAARAVELLGQDAPCLLVVDGDGRLVGIMTDRDLLNRVAAERLALSDTRISEVMTPKPEALTPYACVTYAINQMAMGGYRNVPIVDDDGRPLAVLTVRDVVEHLHMVFEELEGAAPDPRAPEWVDIGGSG